MSQKKKKQDLRKSGIKGKKEEKSELKIPSYFNYIFGSLLLAIFILSLYLRTVMPYDSVFRNGVVAFASDDAVFQMRLVENTLHNFPHRLVYDAFTLYPYGNALHWGPLWTQTIATLSLIAGRGSYDMQTVNTIAAFYPGVLGALVVFPVYFIGKHLYNRSTGLLAAFMIAILPGQFFSRSILGFTDHHVAEVLYSTATVAFFILALKAGREKNITFSGLHLKEKSVLYSVLAGVTLAAYQLTWPGAPLFAMIIAIFILIQYIVDHMQGKSTDYLAVASVPMFFINLIFVLPYVNPSYGFGIDKYSWFHVAVPLGGMGIAIALSIVSIETKKRGYRSYHFPVFLGGLFAFVLLVMKTVLPQMYSTVVIAPFLIFAQHLTGGASTIAEAMALPTRLEQYPGEFWGEFPVISFLQKDDVILWFIIAVLFITGYRVVRKQKPEEMLFLVWNVVMFLAIYGQIRWMYYFAVNMALMVGYVGAALSERILKFGGWDWQIDTNYLKNISINHLFSSVLVVLVVLFFAYPSVVSTAIGTKERPPGAKFGGGEPSGGGFSEWLETLTWMRYNTPDPGMDYFAIYKKPENGTYPYPETAYGVMSWWDYGHMITYWGHRIPNANPFQSGIGGGSQHLPGASTFLTAKTEEEASGVINALGINGKPGSRYIVSNAYMAYQIMEVFGIWAEDEGYKVLVQTNSGPVPVPSQRYYETMEAKLHIFDGNGLKQYRMVHESPRNPYNDEPYYKNVYNLLYGGKIPQENTGLVKVFEYVKGARITGRAPPNSTVTLTNTIKTNIGRTIQYSQTITSDGTYAFTVPYSTKDPITGPFECTGCFFTGKDGDTQFDTKPTGPYTVTADNISKTIDVSEMDVLAGHTVTLDLQS